MGVGKRWLGVWLDPQGVERSKAFETKAQAIRYASSMETDRDRGDYLDPTPARRSWTTSVPVARVAATIRGSHFAHPPVAIVVRACPASGGPAAGAACRTADGAGTIGRPATSLPTAVRTPESACRARPDALADMAISARRSSCRGVCGQRSTVGFVGCLRRCRGFWSLGTTFPGGGVRSSRGCR